MSVSLRLTRMGSKKKPFYRIIAIDSRVERDGRYIEQIGIYNPLTGEKKVNSDIALKWLNQGAIPSQTVRDIFSEQGVMKSFHESKQKPKSKEESKPKKESGLKRESGSKKEPGLKKESGIKKESKPKAKPRASAKPKGDSKSTKK